jgi:sensor histidine kinase regulating citrate/malate metabolism
MEWGSYAVFCSTVGKAEIDVTNNSVHEVIKLPALMSVFEHGQENIGTNIDVKGELIISNLSPYYSGTIVSCEFYHKFGL